MIVCPRVVIDTNIIVSALIFGGRVSRLRLAWQDNRFTSLVSKATTAELIRVLTYPKFKLTPTEQEDLLSDYILYCEAVAMPDLLPVIPECRDPFDEPLVVTKNIDDINCNSDSNHRFVFLLTPCSVI